MGVLIMSSPLPYNPLMTIILAEGSSENAKDITMRPSYQIIHAILMYMQTICNILEIIVINNKETINESELLCSMHGLLDNMDVVFIPPMEMLIKQMVAEMVSKLCSRINPESRQSLTQSLSYDYNTLVR